MKHRKDNETLTEDILTELERWCILSPISFRFYASNNSNIIRGNLERYEQHAKIWAATDDARREANKGDNCLMKGNQITSQSTADDT